MRPTPGRLKGGDYLCITTRSVPRPGRSGNSRKLTVKRVMAWLCDGVAVRWHGWAMAWLGVLSGVLSVIKLLAEIIQMLYR